MRHAAPAPTTALVFFLLMIFMLVGCSAGIEIRKVELSKDMAPFKDTQKRMEFQFPPGWQQSPVDPVIDKSTANIRLAAPAAFRKADRGTLAVWCDKYDNVRAEIIHMNDVIRAYAPLVPLDKPAETYFEIDSPGSGTFSRPTVCGYKATHVEKGEKKDFFIVTVIKSPTMTKLNQECTYMLFGWSTSDEFTEEIKADIIAVAASLRNSDAGREAAAEAAAIEEHNRKALAKIDYEAMKDRIVKDVLAKIAQGPQAKKDEGPKEFDPVPHDASVRWQAFSTTLMYHDITGLKLVAPDKLLVTIDGSDPRLLNTGDGSLLWEQKTLRYDESGIGKSKEKGKAETIAFPT